MNWKEKLSKPKLSFREIDVSDLVEGMLFKASTKREHFYTNGADEFFGYFHHRMPPNPAGRDNDDIWALFHNGSLHSPMDGTKASLDSHFYNFYEVLK